MALIDLIEPEIIKVPLISLTKPDIIKELIDVLKGAGKIQDYQTVYDALMEREARGSTGLEMGIAVPHAKTGAVDTLTIAMGISPQGVDFESMDGEPSHLFFLILAAPDQSGPHIEALAEIARVAQSPSFYRMLCDSKSAEEVVQLIKEE